MGDQGAAGTAAAALTGQVRSAYEAAQQDWAAGPQQVYAALATALLAQAAPWVTGQEVLDAGAGTGLAAAAALDLGARRVVAADLAPGLLRQAGPRLHPVAASIYALPFRNGSFGLVAAAFSLSHLSDLSAGLAELRRVGRVMVASTFAPGWTHPAKAAVDGVLARSGYRPPAWYLEMKNEGEPRLADASRFRRYVRAAGYGQLESRTVTVPTMASTPAQLAAWRLGLAHVAPYVRSLAMDRRQELLSAARHAAEGCPPLDVSMLIYIAC